MTVEAKRELSYDLRLAASMIDAALALHAESQLMPKGKPRSTAEWAAKVMRQYADLVVHDRLDREVATAYLDAARLIVKGMRRARS